MSHMDEKSEAEHLFKIGTQLYSSGNLKEAEMIFEKLTLNNTESFFYLGMINKIQGKFSEAIEKFSEMIKINHNHADAFFNLAICQNLTGSYDDAINNFKKSLNINPKNYLSFANIASIYQLSGKYYESIENYLVYLKFNPNDSRVYNNLGLVYESTGNYKEAEDYFLKAVNIEKCDNYFANLALLYYSQARYPEAVDYYLKAIELNPYDPDYHNNLGTVYQTLNLFNDAENSYKEALKYCQSNPQIYNNLASVLESKGKYEEAVLFFLEAINLDSENANYYYNLGTAYKGLGKYNDAAGCFKKSIGLKPDYPEPHFNLSIILLLTGNIIEGLTEYEWRLETGDAEKFVSSKQKWNGENINNKTILVKKEQGLGDSIQFFRYLKLLQKKGCRIIFESPSDLISLYSNVSGYYDEIIDRINEQNYDYYIHLMSLPLLLNTGEINISSEIPYIRVKPGIDKKWSEKLKEYDFFKIGFAWEGNPSNKNNLFRSCSFDYFYNLAKNLNTRLFSIQMGNAVKQISDSKKDRIIDLSKFINDFNDTAAIINNLDLLISVDTSVAHLCGAIGKPVWTILPYLPDWRWGLSGEKTSLYPSMRLFRQAEMNNWDSVFENIQNELAKYLIDK